MESFRFRIKIDSVSPQEPLSLERIRPSIKNVQPRQKSHQATVSSTSNLYVSRTRFIKCRLSDSLVLMANEDSKSGIPVDDWSFAWSKNPLTNHITLYDNDMICTYNQLTRSPSASRALSLRNKGADSFAELFLLPSVTLFRNSQNGILFTAGMMLAPNAAFPKRDGPVALIVMDGVGLAPDKEWNAVTTSRTPFLDKLMAGKGPDGATALYTELEASGKSVGLPSNGDMGNSEVGHNALGAGRVFDQGAKLVNNAFNDGSFRKGEVWSWLIEQCVPSAGTDSSGTLHLIGLYSDGNVHAHVNHVYQLVDAAVDEGVKRIRLHILADGRDVSERSVLDYLGPLEKRLESVRAGGVDARIASGGGRMIVTMDRYNADWGIVQRGWNAHVLADTENVQSFPSATEAVEKFYGEGLVDQYLPPFVIVDGDNVPLGPIEDGDSVLFWNFRGDRAIEISTAFETPVGEFPHFERRRVPDVRYAGMMQYDGDAQIPTKFLVSPPAIDRTVPEYCVKNGLKRFSVSETQKYGHVTYFYNGNRAAKFDLDLEKYVCIESYKQKEDTRPWMRAAEITDTALKEIDEFKPDLIVINYPNGDMVGHTGSCPRPGLRWSALTFAWRGLYP